MDFAKVYSAILRQELIGSAEGLEPAGILSMKGVATMLNQFAAKEFMPRSDLIAKKIAIGAVGGLVGIVLLTLDEPLSMTKLLKVAGGAVIGAVVGFFRPDKRDARKW